MDNKIRQLVQKNIRDIILSPKERFVLGYRFGLTDKVAHSLEETGRISGVTRERIRQIEVKALEKIKTLRSVRRKNN